MDSIGFRVQYNGDVSEHGNGRFKFIMLVTFLTNRMNNYTAQWGVSLLTQSPAKIPR